MLAGAPTFSCGPASDAGPLDGGDWTRRMRGAARTASPAAVRFATDADKVGDSNVHPSAGCPPDTRDLADAARFGDFHRDANNDGDSHFDPDRGPLAYLSADAVCYAHPIADACADVDRDALGYPHTPTYAVRYALAYVVPHADANPATDDDTLANRDSGADACPDRDAGADANAEYHARASGRPA